MAFRNTLQGFRKFILRGNVVDLAVGVIIGAAFSSVVSAFTRDLLTPLISAIIRQPNFSGLRFIVNKATFSYGDLLDTIISFLITALVIYFFVVVPLNSLIARFQKEPSPDPSIQKCPECLSDIPKDAKRCKFCTAQLK